MFVCTCSFNFLVPPMQLAGGGRTVAVAGAVVAAVAGGAGAGTAARPTPVHASAPQPPPHPCGPTHAGVCYVWY